MVVRIHGKYLTGIFHYQVHIHRRVDQNNQNIHCKRNGKHQGQALHRLLFPYRYHRVDKAPEGIHLHPSDSRFLRIHQDIRSYICLGRFQCMSRHFGMVLRHIFQYILHNQSRHNLEDIRRCIHQCLRCMLRCFGRDLGHIR